MKDKEFLMWIHDRLEYVHKENHHADYMHKLRSIINGMVEEYPDHVLEPPKEE